MKKYTIGLLNCEIDIEVESADNLKIYMQDEKILYIVDENGKEVFFDKARTIATIMEI